MVGATNVIAGYLGPYGGIFGPEDLELLQKLFDEFCEARGYAAKSADAEHTAFLFFTLFQGGIVDEGSLRKALPDSGLDDCAAGLYRRPR